MSDVVQGASFPTSHRELDKLSKRRRGLIRNLEILRKLPKNNISGPLALRPRRGTWA